MPELPEVETTRRGIAPSLEGQRLVDARIRERRLRWPVPADLAEQVSGAWVNQVARRAKYLLLHLNRGTLIVHLGMSGNLRVLPANTPPGPHDHLDLLLENGPCLRFHDPRRFGAVLWCAGPTAEHPLLRDLGPEPLEAEFDGTYLVRAARGRRVAIKHLLMNGHVVAGIGNIYASESLFLAGVHPQRSCHQLTVSECDRLAVAIRQVLTEAIDQGGTTLRDFRQADGRPGYFAQNLRVYGRTNAPCIRCTTPIETQRIGQRSSFFCPQCQN